MPIDNLKMDSRGDIYVPGFPDVVGLMRSSFTLEKLDVGSTVWRVREVIDSGEERRGWVVSGPFFFLFYLLFSIFASFFLL